jgi:ATP-dependent RNA/DNA helicase IGHMBP2
MSVDNIVEKLIKSSVKKVKVCRVGHPARMIPHIWNVSLDALVNSSEEAAMARKAKAELNKLLPKMLRSKDKEEKREMRIEIKLLKKDIKKFEQQAVKMILDGSDVILGTNTGIADKKVWDILKIKKYIVVIDEAAQAIEASCWIPIRLASKLVLAGDHKQLAPTIKSIKAAKQGLEITLFERLMVKYSEFSSLLDIQYRMNNTIMNWSSEAMYEGLLKADKSVADASLKKKKLTDEQVLESDMLLIDTVGCQFGESVDDKDENDSKYNIGYNLP